ncbi:MAG: pirin family protein [Bacteroidia bacterium]|nr:pirin family protein [Bacteroidia bacterium]
MSGFRAIQQILPPPPAHMVGDGFRVHNFFPNGYDMGIKRMSPFFLLDYGSKIEFPPSEKPRGVGVHPHRGFETVTIAYQGKVAHHDSAGNSGVIGKGDVQWMTAGSGVLHKEYHDKEYSLEGGLFQMVQLWVNLPAKFKMTAPRYQGITNSNLNKYHLPGERGTVEVIAGHYKDVQGSALTFSTMNVYNCHLIKDAEIKFKFQSTHNTGILIIEGSVKINDAETAEQDHFILFGNEGSEIKIEALDNCIFLVLSGEPIDEPIVPYGPFLMNTKEEIQQAYSDLHAGKFGILED